MPTASPTERLAEVRARIADACRACGRPPDAVRLVAVGKSHPPAALRALAAAGQHAFAENRVQEGMAKRTRLADLDLEWHLIGPLQSNKCRDAAQYFDWLQSLDRAKLVPLLAGHREAARPLQVLVQVKIDDEATKSGAAAAEVPALADTVAAAAALSLRGLMTIPAPGPPAARRRAFATLRTLFERMQRDHPGMDTLSMGMSDDFELAIAEGATMVRVGTALFGFRA
ncbi:MAG TPA: YggS family pyridoxal phosphate-dependent enzyme [Xanthomonadaceae bacterium]|nr:YggS family pyridoxal phosphate-dependent enzyme [Xanthomonadaceae bacterium]